MGDMTSQTSAPIGRPVTPYKMQLTVITVSKHSLKLSSWRFSNTIRRAKAW